ncbi:MAG: SMP-30/gluconolactonase/LRE family protein [Tannerella sp.]|jgi:sugar lactone lactonase YvrE|nr:SMP-30/gluconolactonase/LRE family protein [Tannerella sp.]
MNTEKNKTKMTSTLLYRCYDQIGEAATWLPHQEIFLWVDIDNALLHEYHPETNSVTDHSLPDMVTTIIPNREKTDEIWLALRNRLVSYHLKTGVIKELTILPAITPELRTNDGKSSPEGRIWLGVMHRSNHDKTGSLYCVEKDFSCRKILENQCIPNGIVWNRTGDTMYYADSGQGCIYRFAYDAQQGAIHSQQIAIQVPKEYGVPDGMAIDDRGFLWVAHWGGFGVYVWNPETGKLTDKIDVPTPLVASCAFGGKRMNELYITTARDGLSDEEKERFPLSGSLFVATLLNIKQ